VLAQQLDAWTEELGDPGPHVTEVELHHGLRAAALVVASARLRTESRGGHWREDFPAPDPGWEGVHLERTPVAATGSPGPGRDV
jgi:L-aspartate oxidase